MQAFDAQCFTINDVPRALDAQSTRELLPIRCSFTHIHHDSGHLYLFMLRTYSATVTETMKWKVTPACVVLIMRAVSINNQRIWVLVLHARSDPIILKIPFSLGNGTFKWPAASYTKQVGRVREESAGRVGCVVLYPTCLPGDNPPD